MNAPDLFSLAPETHAADPRSSEAALQRHKRSGRHGSNARLMYRLASAYPGSTATELYERASAEDQRQLKEPQEARRRLHTLKQLGAVWQGAERACRVRSTLMVTWHARPLAELPGRVRELLSEERS